MRIIKPSFEYIAPFDGAQILKSIEIAGRVCYKSEEKITDTSAAEFVRRIVGRGHESVLEHEKLTFKLICDRGVSHEVVRHRMASYSQESTRYCNYSQAKFGSELTFIDPCFWEKDSQPYALWLQSMQAAEDCYNSLIAAGAKPEEARSILPNRLKTEIVVTMNMRELRHFLRLRTSPAAHPQMREIADALLADLKQRIPVLFDDIG